MVKVNIRRFLRLAIAGSSLGAVLFLLSGAWADPWLWTYFGLWIGLLTYALLRLDDDLARERFKPPTRGADAAWLTAVQIIALSHVIVGPLDVRWRLSHVPSPLRAAAYAGVAACALLVFRSMHANRFFSAVVRIQGDRGHRVVDSGPYAVVRHPGYAGMVPVMALSGLALGSWPAFALGVVYGVLILRRVLFEDRFLQENLLGYREYARRVPFRLVPGVW